MDYIRKSVLINLNGDSKRFESFSYLFYCVIINPYKECNITVINDCGILNKFMIITQTF